MIDHFTLRVRDYERSLAFYGAALKPLGYGVLMRFEGYAGLGAGKPDLWITGDPGARPMHFALHASDRKTVDAFHAAALAAGGTDNGPPGIRKDYHPNYYAAFVLDPDGHNLEVVCHAPPKRARAPARRAQGRKGARPVASRARGSATSRRRS